MLTSIRSRPCITKPRTSSLLQDITPYPLSYHRCLNHISILLPETEIFRHFPMRYSVAISQYRVFKPKSHAFLHLLAASNNPCSTYNSLNAVNRLDSFTGQSPVRCDQKDLTPGWYRFTGVSGNPKMPTQCVSPTRRCGTHAPGWLNGQHPSVADGEVTRQVCYHWSNNCCRWKNNIKVKNCGAFYVYELQKTPVCSLRYCGTY